MLRSKTKILNAFRKVGMNLSVERMMMQYTQGRSHKTFAARLLPQNYQYPKNAKRTISRYGFKWELDISDYMQYCLYFGIVTEPRKKLYDLVPDAGIVIDVGVNFGETLLHFSKLAPKGTVIGFEPIPFLYHQCKHHLEINHITNAHLHNLALSDKPEKLNFNLAVVHNTGGFSMQKSTNGQGIVNAVRLDDFCLENKIEKVDLIKIDVEGFEYNVLLGAQQVLARHKPTLFIELDDTNLKKHNSSAKQLVALLLAVGYRITNAETDDALDANANFDACHYDIICRIEN
ncbi:MAG: FkbM family methyltransferase [Bacteroidetes bacterium]|nr:FkbM family methyltransferase [Bacteroidota bacterium]